MKESRSKTYRFMRLFFCIIFISQGCNLFEKDERLLYENVRSNGESIKVYYVGLGATTTDVIQVRKGNQKTPLKVFQQYNFLKSSKLINDTSLELIMSDTGYHNFNNRFDTIILNIK